MGQGPQDMDWPQVDQLLRHTMFAEMEKAADAVSAYFFQ